MATGSLFGLGAMGFGGPVALVGYMHRDLVEQRAWITDADYKEGLALAQLAPGPMAARNGHLPGLCPLPHSGGHTGWHCLCTAIIFHGGGAGLGLQPVWRSVVDAGRVLRRGCSGDRHHRHQRPHKLTSRAFGKDKLLWAIFLVLAAVTVITESEIAWLFIAAGVVNWLWRAPPKSWGGGRVATAAVDMAHTGGFMATLDWSLLTQIGVFFAKAGAFVLGSGLAIVPFLTAVLLQNTTG